MLNNNNIMSTRIVMAGWLTAVVVVLLLSTSIGAEDVTNPPYETQPLHATIARQVESVLQRRSNRTINILPDTINGSIATMSQRALTNAAQQQPLEWSIY